MGDEPTPVETLVYEYEECLDREKEALNRVVQLEIQVRRFAERVTQLFRQRAGLVSLLRSIKNNGGCAERHWRSIDRILASGRWDAFEDEDSGRH